jgi:hypothetical protein
MTHDVYFKVIQYHGDKANIELQFFSYVTIKKVYAEYISKNILDASYV